MRNGAILRRTPTLFISRWLIDPNGDVYQGDAEKENIIIFTTTNCRGVEVVLVVLRDIIGMFEITRKRI